jgi:uncharacterized membrane protein
MHLTVAISVAYPLTRDRRLARGVGVLALMVAYMLYEKAWSRAAAVTPAANTQA